MFLSFERGESRRPKGHALAYIRNSANPDEIYATYLVVPPIVIDLVKYMPPMFAGKLPLADMEQISAIPLPPMPEKVEGIPYLLRMAERRDDDVVNLGSMNVTDIQSMLLQITDAAQEYLRAYTSYMSSFPATPEPEPSRPSLSATVDDVLLSLLSERDKLGEFSKLVGKLRYAVDGQDRLLVQETVEEMEALGRHLPERFRVTAIIAAARTAGEKGRRLTELHMSRCYKLADEDFRAVEDIENRIRLVEGE